MADYHNLKNTYTVLRKGNPRIVHDPTDLLLEGINPFVFVWFRKDGALRQEFFQERRRHFDSESVLNKRCWDVHLHG